MKGRQLCVSYLGLVCFLKENCGKSALCSLDDKDDTTADMPRRQSLAEGIAAEGHTCY
jgi:hypothetical protein